MNNLNKIGLDKDKSENLSQHLNDLLANYSVFYQNTRGYHWNVQGEKFFELHLKFEEIYNDLVVKIDEIAERILTLGAIPEHRYSVYTSVSEIPESAEVNDGKRGMERILNSFQIILEKQRKILELSAEMNDEGTNAQMSDYISQQEKLVWMFTAYLK